MKKMKINKLIALPISILILSSCTNFSTPNQSVISESNTVQNTSFDTQSLMIRFNENVSQDKITAFKSQYNLNDMVSVSKELNLVQIKVNNVQDAMNLKNKLEKNDLVKYVERDGKLSLFSYTSYQDSNLEPKSFSVKEGAKPNDTFYGLQWHSKTIGADNVWTMTTGTPDVVVAVIDSGVDPEHPDLQENLLPLIDMVDESGEVDVFTIGSTRVDYSGKDGNGHGTHVTGILAAKINNGKGTAGIAGNVKILPIKAANHEGNTSASIITKSILRAIDEGVKVINLSIGGPKSEGTQALKDAVDLAIEKGIVFVSATGNESNRSAKFVEAVTVPAAYPGVIAVSATTKYDKVANYSNGGVETEIAAPGGGGGKPEEGEKIYSTWPTYRTYEGYRANILGPYTYLSGTSMSCPQVSATAALLLSKYPYMTGQQIRVRILATAKDVDAVGFDNSTGFGRLDTYSAFISNSHDKKEKILP
jgi:subtilisin family serine protease